MSKNLNNIFYINKLCLINIDSLLSQFIDNTQPFSIQGDKKEEFYNKKHYNKKKIKKKNRRNSIK